MLPIRGMLAVKVAAAAYTNAARGEHDACEGFEVLIRNGALVAQLVDVLRIAERAHFCRRE